LIFSDRSLSQKLERAEAKANAEFVDSRAELCPDSGAAWIEVGGAYALFDGPESPCTQTFGLGLFEETTDKHLDKIERFFAEKGSQVFHEVSPINDPALMALLNERGYAPIELTSVMFRLLDDTDCSGRLINPKITTRLIDEDEVPMFTKTSVEGWSAEMPDFASFGAELCRVSANSKVSRCFIAELDREPIATGTLLLCGDVAILAGASTIPNARNMGAQNALLQARLKFAGENGCTLATMGALPGGQSQMNAQKNGFTIAYTRTKWRLMNQSL
jgi:hypothetical protein